MIRGNWLKLREIRAIRQLAQVEFSQEFENFLLSKRDCPRKGNQGDFWPFERLKNEYPKNENEILKG